MKKALAILGMIFPFIFWFLWLISAILLNEVSVESTNLMINLFHIKTFAGIWFLFWVVTMLTSIIYLWREEWLRQVEIIKPSWKLARKNVWKYSLWIALMLVLQIIQTELSNSSRPATLFMSVLVILFLIAYVRIDFGLRNISLSLVNDKKIKIMDVFVEAKKFFKYLIAYIIMWLLILAWFVFFIVPWILISFRLSMVPYIMLEKNIGPWTAIKESWYLTKDKAANLFALNIILVVINMFWLLAIFVWLFWTLPLLYIASAMFYQKLLLLKK